MDAVRAVLESGQLAQGGRVEEFEAAFAAFVGSRFAVATSSGTTALQLAMEGLGIGPGDEVVTVSFTFTASVSAILHAGARPVFIDIEREYLTMDPSQIESAMSPRTRAVPPGYRKG